MSAKTVERAAARSSDSRWLRLPAWSWALLLMVPALLDAQSDGLYVGNGTDLFSYQYPLRATVAAMVRDGQAPWWNPYLLGGVPALAGMQLGLLYPPNWLGLLAPWAATEWQLWLHLGWMAMGWTLLAQTWNRRLSPFLAVVVAAVAVYSGPTWGHVWAGHISFVQAWAWWPWIWLWLLRWMDTGSSRTLGWAAAALACQVLAGHPQVTWMTVVTATVPLAVRALASGPIPTTHAAPARTPHGSLGALGLAGLGIVATLCGAAVLAAAQLGPLVQLQPALNRTLSTPLEIATAYAAPPATWWTAIAPAAWGGTTAKLGSWSYHETVAFVGPAAIALAALGLGWQRRGAWLLALAMGVLALLSLGDHGPLLPALSNLPGLGSFRVPGRWVAGVVALLALLVADGLAPPPTQQRRWMAAWPLGVGILLGLGALGGVDDPHGWRITALLPSAQTAAVALARDHTVACLLLLVAALAVALGGVLAPRWASRCRALLAVMVVGHGLVFAADHLGQRHRTPAALDHPWQQDAAVLMGAVGEGHRLATAAALRQADWTGLAGLRGAGGYEPAITVDQNRYGNLLAGRSRDGYAVLFQVRGPSVVADRMAVSHLVAAADDAAAARQFAAWPLVTTLPSGRVLRANPHPHPRVAASTDWRSVADPVAALTALQQDPASPLLLSGAQIPAAPRGEGCAVQMAGESSTKVSVRALCPRGGAVVLRDADAPGWSVSVDGRPAVSLRADGLFRAAIVGPGTHEVTWRYVPGSWPWTPLVSVAAWAALAVWLWRVRRRGALAEVATQASS